MMKRFPYKKLAKYPHLLAEDVILWERFIDQQPTAFDYCDYDIHVGEGMEIDPSWPPEIQRMATILSQFRIDVIGWKGNIPTIIEVKPKAASKALGQIILYRSLFLKTFPSYPSAKSLIITDWDHKEVLAVAFQNNIKIVTV